MPCYEPPPPWEKEARSSAIEAVKILCAHIQAELARHTILPQLWLIWFLEHRKIDLQIATTEYFGHPDPIEAEKCREDIRYVEGLIE